jgi:hypothetical protein
MLQLCNRRYTAVLLITLFVFASSGMTLYSGVVLCVHGSDHVALEFEHNGHVSLSEYPGSAPANPQSIFMMASQQEAADRCLDIPVSVSLASQSATSAHPSQSTTVTPACVAFTSLSSSCRDALYVVGRPYPPWFQTSTFSSLLTTVLLI